MEKTEFTMIPAFILKALQEAQEADVVPRIKAGAGGNSHSVWFIAFDVRRDDVAYYSKYHNFVVKITSSYSQSFLDLELVEGVGVTGAGTNYRTMSAAVAQAAKNVDALYPKSA